MIEKEEKSKGPKYWTCPKCGDMNAAAAKVCGTCRTAKPTPKG